MRISDWSSDVCSSDLSGTRRAGLRDSAAGRVFTDRCCRLERLDERLAALPHHDQDAPARSDREHRRQGPPAADPRLRRRQMAAGRSEEHTSELQSLMRISYAVFCLKKKTKTHN